MQEYFTNLFNFPRVFHKTLNIPTIFYISIKYLKYLLNITKTIIFSLNIPTIFQIYLKYSKIFIKSSKYIIIFNISMKYLIYLINISYIIEKSIKYQIFLAYIAKISYIYIPLIFWYLIPSPISIIFFQLITHFSYLYLFFCSILFKKYRKLPSINYTYIKCSY